jgi:hypothetical protein
MFQNSRCGSVKKQAEPAFVQLGREREMNLAQKHIQSRKRVHFIVL